MTISYSPLATRVTAGVRDPKLANLRKVWGFLLHTTGSGVTAQAKREHSKPIDVALKIYINYQNGAAGYFWGGPNYVIDHDGTAYQIAPDEARTEHAGSNNRMLYHTGGWVHRVSPEVVLQWQKRWPTRKHPYSMFPSVSPNIDYVGCEMIPIGDGFGGQPMGTGLRFTKAQHDTAIALGRDLACRHGWPAGWESTGRLLGHEDVDPVVRSDARGGWDPGAMRAAPYFDFDYVKQGIAAP